MCRPSRDPERSTPPVRRPVGVGFVERRGTSPGEVRDTSGSLSRRVSKQEVQAREAGGVRPRIRARVVTQSDSRSTRASRAGTGPARAAASSGERGHWSNPLPVPEHRVEQPWGGTRGSPGGRAPPHPTERDHARLASQNRKPTRPRGPPRSGARSAHGNGDVTSRTTETAGTDLLAHHYVVSPRVPGLARASRGAIQVDVVGAARVQDADQLAGAAPGLVTFAPRARHRGRLAIWRARRSVRDRYSLSGGR